ncbi:hypothetical protein J2Y38_000756 [Flavobacterium sp. 2755]|uniref:hypothetical protein n=1 Tax=Flavobacterium sp. 2755 TaxID=2817765 RepID=UPI0028551FB0|nr:hypothetical protein [Flavobacterium sp. 2755]MDR6760577.1 hypothetical protein [Flavobacterium sp. 2755]
MGYKIKPLDTRDRKNIYLLFLFFSCPGIIILLVYCYIAIFWSSSEIFINSLPLILACIIIPHIFSIKYLIVLKNNEKYVVKGILTYVCSIHNGTCWYTVDEKDKFTTTSIGDIFCDRLQGGNVAELHILPYMYSKKKIFYAKRISESYEMTLSVIDIKINKTESFISIVFSNFGTHTFLKSSFFNSIKIGDILLVKVTTEITSGKPLFTFEKITSDKNLKLDYRF